MPRATAPARARGIQLSAAATTGFSTGADAVAGTGAQSSLASTGRRGVAHDLGRYHRDLLDRRPQTFCRRFGAQLPLSADARRQARTRAATLPEAIVRHADTRSAASRSSITGSTPRPTTPPMIAPPAPISGDDAAVAPATRRYRRRAMTTIASTAAPQIHGPIGPRYPGLSPGDSANGQTRPVNEPGTDPRTGLRS